MGHAIGRLSFAEDTPKEEIVAECNKWEYANKDLHEGGILEIGKEVKYFKDKVYDNEEDADTALDDITSGLFYPQMAVLYRRNDKLYWLVHLETHC